MEVEREAEQYYSSGCPRDLLQRFADGSSLNDKPPETAVPKVEDVSDEIELSLGLSLNGSFGVDPKRTKLIRSSSASLPRELDFTITAAADPFLARTYSLPVESEEDQRKRKELQSLRRLEAKRKRSEKRRSMARPDGHTASPPARQLDVVFPPLWRPGCGQCPPPVGQGSVGSQCSSSSGASDLDGRQAAASRGGGVDERRQQLRRTRSAATERNVMEEMPCVSTRGEGPNGRRIEGVLYKYRKGGEVRIVCVCHGSFLTPAEFVRHAGGGEVVHPLRHIVVTSASSSSPSHV